MGAEDDRALEIAASIADGTPPHWDPDELRSDELTELRIISEIAAVNRGLPDETAVTMSVGDLSRGRPDVSAAERWGPLLLLERVGGGGFGEVYRAWDPALDHEVALKLLRVPAPTASAYTDTADRRPSSVVREGQLLARVRHPNVITVHGALEADNRVGIWMDFVRGRTLDQVVRDEGSMSAAEATVIGDSLCRAVAAVHRVGLLHRDIKASNVMREAGGRIVLLDFGAGSEVTLASTPAGRRRVAGTPLYMAPELLMGAGPSVQSDIYSLGVLLFYLVTSAYPVNGRSVDEIGVAHQAGRRAWLSDLRPDLPPTFITVVERALSPDPGHRYQSAGAMLRDLTAMARPVSTPPDPVPRPAAAWAVAAAGGIAGSLVLVTVLGYFTSAMFRLHHGIANDFVSEGPPAYAALGAQSLVPTLFYAGVAVLLFYAASAVVDLIVGMMPALRRPGRRLADAWRSIFRRANLDDASKRAKLACAGGAAGFGAIVWLFRDLLSALASRIDVAPVEALSILHPRYEGIHDLYGLSLDMLLLMLLVALVRALRARATGRPAVGPVAGMVALAGLALLFHAGAWRILYRNEFRQATFERQTCYVLARNEAEALIHCPHSPAPRNRVVNQSDVRLELTGRVGQLERVRRAVTSGAAMIAPCLWRQP